MAARTANLKVAFITLGVFTGMLGLSYAAVPFYRMYCAATGYQGALRSDTKGPSTVGSRILHVRFDANVAPGLDWKFEPETTGLDVRVGQVATVYYRVTNRSNHSIRAKAADNVSPDQAGRYFAKIRCFCDEDKTLAPGESTEMPVVFYLDPSLEKARTMKNVDSVTLSYTYFVSKDATVTGQAVEGDKKL